ncbi:MAG: efflux RND transporter periplasmic adaptor subunit [Thiohalocapsa sp.]|uniref:efflux RND transporter periplasmic adaptor subunit n=1 Tax=Thiohalocapsa sp. TaxID=2497641 RepID=UPI0025D7AF1C|nr:efflux RND transporter periplasmic adaptor subunit [Thiohalocapsa sp.]MCG6943372.1 efflux RND transporter periplasmic adaptor subunit [Thiohalocapsa sp.]
MTRPPLLLVLAALLPLAVSAQQQGSQPPPAVVVAAVETQNVSRSARFIGNIQAIQSVDLKARVEGYLEDVAFAEGSMVDKGQLLYRIEQDQYKAALEQAEGQLAAAKADAAAAAAALEDKESDYQRQSALIKKGDTSQTAFDQAKAARDEALANVDKAKASEQQGQAQVDNAKINLGYTIIKSPIAGRIGATAVTQGNLVSSSSGTLATVVQLNPIRAVFSVPSADLVRLQKRVGAATSEKARTAYVPDLILPDGTNYDHPGKISFANNQVDTSTGTVAIYADFANPQHLLLPGQFVSVVVHQAKEERLPVVPAAAVMRTREGVQVFVVNGNNRVQARKVDLGPRVDTGYAVNSGLTDGELVIVSGLQKVQPGMTVKPSGAGKSSGSSSGGSTTGSNAGAGAKSTAGGVGAAPIGDSASETAGDTGSDAAGDSGGDNAPGTTGDAEDGASGGSSTGRSASGDAGGTDTKSTGNGG